VCFQDARKYIPDLSERRALDAAIGLTVLGNRTYCRASRSELI
jgi:hypothetical protein